MWRGKGYRQKTIKWNSGLVILGWDTNLNSYTNPSGPLFYIHAGLGLRQGYVPEKWWANETQNSHVKQCIFWGLGDWNLILYSEWLYH